MDIKQTQYDRTALAQLKQRVAANYENFKADVLMMSGQAIYDMAHRIAIVKDAYEQITGDGMDYMDKGEVEFLLKFYDPLEMVADYMEMSLGGEYPVEVDDALAEICYENKADQKYLTMKFAEKLMDKYGEDTPVAISLLQETIEAGERYVRLMKLTDLYDHTAYPHHDIPLKPFGAVLDFDDDAFDVLGFDDDGFFIYEDEDELEGCF